MSELLHRSWDATPEPPPYLIEQLAELDGSGVQHTEHKPERHEVEQRTDRSEDQHEPADEDQVPV